MRPTGTGIAGRITDVSTPFPISWGSKGVALAAKRIPLKKLLTNIFLSGILKLSIPPLSFNKIFENCFSQFNLKKQHEAFKNCITKRHILFLALAKIK
jgi:hypothetical protein